LQVLVTGAFGNVGESAVVELLERGDRVRAFDLRTRATEKAARRYRGRIELAWGDVRNRADLARAVADVDAVVHTAFVIPPSSESRPAWAREINVGGTRNLIAAMRERPQPARLVYTSSVSVFGPRGPEDAPPVSVDHPVKASDTYTGHKLETEEMVRESALDWIILRLGAVMALELPRGFDSLAFEIPVEQRMEAVHTRDVGLALANAVDCDEAVGRTLLIGGGERCRMSAGEMRAGFAGLLGLPTLPDSAFSRRPFYTDFMDTAEAQRMLRFQRHAFVDCLEDLGRRISPPRRLLLRLFGGFLVRRQLARSPYHRG
jgi:nucleoside-diphosphate-sugar epimerase